MQALRKTVAQPQSRPSDAAPSPTTDWGLTRPTGEQVAGSPALALREHLAARLEELAILAGPRDAAVMDDYSDKLPMPVRVGIIASLSIAFWLSLYFAAAAVL